MPSLREWFEEEFAHFYATAGRRLVPQTSIISSPGEEQTYLELHKERYFETLQVLERFVPDTALKILDIGTSHFTLLLRKKYAHVTTIDGGTGWKKPVQSQDIIFKRFDLRDKGIPFEPESFDVVLCSEVIEHIPYTPTRLLEWCYRLVRPNGLLLLATPNATSYYHRRDFLFGKVPFALPPQDDHSASWGHVREYTMREMKDSLTAAKFSLLHAEYPWYWNRFPRIGIISRLKGILMHGLFILVPSFRDALLLVAKKTSDDSQK